MGSIDGSDRQTDTNSTAGRAGRGGAKGLAEPRTTHSDLLKKRAESFLLKKSCAVLI